MANGSGKPTDINQLAKAGWGCGYCVARGVRPMLRLLAV
jgi:hypothetical protein